MEKDTIKGQAVLEFLMTYGWAILVVIIAISALIFFQVPQKLIENKQCEQNPENCLCFEYEGGISAEDNHYDPFLKDPRGQERKCTDLRKMTEQEYCNI